MKKACNDCHEIHLRVLHNVGTSGSCVCLITPKDSTSIAISVGGDKVYLKFVPVIVSHGSKLLQTYAILDDAAEHTIILSATAEYLELELELKQSSLL